MIHCLEGTQLSDWLTTTPILFTEWFGFPVLSHFHLNESVFRSLISVLYKSPKYSALSQWKICLWPGSQVRLPCFHYHPQRSVGKDSLTLLFPRSDPFSCNFPEEPIYICEWNVENKYFHRFNPENVLLLGLYDKCLAWARAGAVGIEKVKFFVHITIHNNPYRNDMIGKIHDLAINRIGKWKCVRLLSLWAF